MLKIDWLPGNDAAQCPPDSGACAGQHGILLNRLPQELDQKNGERTVRLT